MFIARQPVLENSFCKHDLTQNTPYVAGSPIVAPQGAVVYISGNDGETTVVRMMDACDHRPFGFLMNELRLQYEREYVPWGGRLPRHQGTQMEFIGAPVGVAHGGLWSTNVYDTDTEITAGSLLYSTASGTLCVTDGAGMCASGTLAYTTPVAVAMNTLTTTRLAQGRQLHILALI
jgi:hypothetical protein